MFGVFEGDTVLSMLFSSGHAIHTEVEKKTKMLFARKIEKQKLLLRPKEQWKRYLCR